MNKPAPAPERHVATRRELRVMGTGGAILFIALFVYYALFLQPPLSPTRLALFGLASLAMAVTYMLALPKSFDLVAAFEQGNTSHLRYVLPIFAGSLFWLLVFFFLLRGRAQMYLLLVAFDGYSALVLFHKRRWAFALLPCLLAAAGLSYASQAGGAAAGAALLRDLPWFVLAVVMGELYARQWLQRERTEALTAELAQANEQLQAYSEQAEKLAVAQERNRLAHEIHDTVGHTFAALSVQVELLDGLPLEPGPARATAARRARALLRSGQAEVWRAVQALRPAALQALSLPEAVCSLAEDFTRATGIEADCRVEGAAWPLEAEYALPLYRAAQEALTNVQRHAPTARDVTLVLRYTPEAVTLSVENSAHPPLVPPAGEGEERGGHGLRGLRARAAALGGAFHAGPGEAGGFRVEMRLPANSER